MLRTCRAEINDSACVYPCLQLMLQFEIAGVNGGGAVSNCTSGRVGNAILSGPKPMAEVMAIRGFDPRSRPGL